MIKVDDVLAVLRLIGQENVKLSSKQLNALIDMLEKEEMLEVESDIEKVLVKLPPDEENADLSEENAEISTSSTETMSRAEGKEDPLAKDLTEQEPEEHIKEMFEETGEKEKVKLKASSHDSKKDPMDLK